MHIDLALHRFFFSKLLDHYGMAGSTRGATVRDGDHHSWETVMLPRLRSRWRKLVIFVSYAIRPTNGIARRKKMRQGVDINGSIGPTDETIFQEWMSKTSWGRRTKTKTAERRINSSCFCEEGKL